MNSTYLLIILQKGMLSNPNDIDLINNYIYSLILEGDLKRASELLKRWVSSDPTSIDDIALTATQGLFFYRSGKPEIGRLFYEGAIETANKLNQPGLAYRAVIYYAREEKRCGEDITNQMAFLQSDKNKIWVHENEPLMHKFGLE